MYAILGADSAVPFFYQQANLKTPADKPDLFTWINVSNTGPNGSPQGPVQLGEAWPGISFGGAPVSLDFPSEGEFVIQAAGGYGAQGFGQAATALIKVHADRTIEFVIRDGVGATLLAGTHSYDSMAEYWDRGLGGMMADEVSVASPV